MMKDVMTWLSIIGNMFSTLGINTLFLLLILCIFLLLLLLIKRIRSTRLQQIIMLEEIEDETSTPEVDNKQESLPEQEHGYAEKPELAQEPISLFTRFRQSLSKTRGVISSGIEHIFLKRSQQDDILEEMEELLITSDVGVETSMYLIEQISQQKHAMTSKEAVQSLLKQEIMSIIDMPHSESIITAKPYVILIVGVNGVGKTTTIGKLASYYSKLGKRVLIAAADTFRAAANEQLTIWAERAGAEIVKHKENSDPAAVAFDSIEAAIARDMDIVIIDTAGRLHTKVNLMEQLKKIKRTVEKRIADAPHETLIVVDATTGQNALNQCRQFHESIGITGITMTKIDGTAKGGIVIGIIHTLNVPLKYLGFGETIDDFEPFNPQMFVDALF
ncbi:MAG: signal recognition particle-docking protein FtsY [Desulfobacterales bacterium]|nr:signal recognition particle-docking protein FtsY [Desulfobacterales bacterium]